MLTGTIRRLVAVFCVAMLGWSQFAVASYSCPQEAPKMDSPHSMQSDCAGDMHRNPSLLCKVHCDKSAPSSHARDISAPALAVLYTAMLIEQPELFETSVHYHQNILAGAFPPLRIQYQSFRN